MAYDVFISYRRATGVDDARLLQQALKARGYEVFFDYDSLRVGRFNDKIFDAIDEAPVFVLMLTQGALDECVNQEDWVRAEIERAIDKRKQIIPVAPSDQKLSYPGWLPPKLQGLPYEQVSELNKTSLFEESVDKIIRNCFPPELRRKTQLSGSKSATRSPLSPSMDIYALWRDADQSPDADVLYGAKKRWQKAVRLYQNAAESGNVDAQYRLGYFYFSECSYLCLRSSYYPEALKWFRIASDNGNPHAQLYLGDMYHYGFGVARNETSAVGWWRKAADQGDSAAKNRIAEWRRERSFSHRVVAFLLCVMGIALFALVVACLGWLLYVTYWVK